MASEENISLNKNIKINALSYETMKNSSFKHDSERGKWDKPWDFCAVALSNCFGIRVFMLANITFFGRLDIMLPFYLLGMITCSIPIFLMQMFLGQFSSTGVLSVFRIAPIFKGIGYAAIVLDIVICSYFMVIAALPLKVIFNSFQSNLPWTHCNNTYNTVDCFVPNVTIDDEGFTSMDGGGFKRVKTSIFQYFNNFLAVDPMNGGKMTDSYDYYFLSPTKYGYEWYFLFQIMLFTFVLWILVGLVLWKGANMLGKISRVITLTVFLCFLVTMVSIFSVEGTFAYIYVLIKKQFTITDINIVGPLLSFLNGGFMITFGFGWGNILTLSSYNKFKDNIWESTLITCSIQTIIFFFITISIHLVERFSVDFYFNLRDDPILMIFSVFTYFFTHAGWSHFCTIIFFFGFVLSNFSEMTIHVFTIITAITDEYEWTRVYKKFILIGSIGFFALTSLLFCTTGTFSAVLLLYFIAGIIQILLVIFEFIVILWIYGRERLRRDVGYMTDKLIPNFIIWIMRFFTPIMFLSSLLCYVIQIKFLTFSSTDNVFICVVYLLIKLIPVLCIPVYIIFKIRKTSGPNRFKRLCQPIYWYPADPIEQQKYQNEVEIQTDV